jgi:DnaA-homolog protein
MKQLVLEIAPPPPATFDNFVIGSNRELVQALRDLSQARFRERVTYVWGESGSGKTHLLDAVCKAAGKVIEASPEAVPDSPLEVTLIVLPDVNLLDDEGQARLFNLINTLGESALLASGPSAPRDLSMRRDLGTRLGSGLVYQVHALTDAEKHAALHAHAKSRGFGLTEEVAGYLLRHARRDMPSLMAMLDQLDRHSLETGRPITLPLLKQALNLH